VFLNKFLPRPNESEKKPIRSALSYGIKIS